MHVSRDFLRSLFLFKSRNNRARKVQTQPRTRVVVALCANHKYLHLYDAGNFHWRNFTICSHSFTNLEDLSIDETVSRKCLQNVNSLGFRWFDWWIVFIIMTMSYDNSFIFKRLKFLAGLGIYKLMDCLQLLRLQGCIYVGTNQNRIPTK